MTPAVQLSDAELEGAVADLAAALGRIPRPSEVARLHRRPDGTFEMATYAPIIPKTELRGDIDHPWRYTSGPGMGTSTSFASIEAVVALFNDPSSAEAEVKRRADLLAEAERQLAENRAKEKADNIREEGERRAERIRRETAFVEFRGADWGRLDPLAKICFSLALAVDDGADLGVELRRLGKSLERTSTIPMPEKKWWLRPIA